MKIITLLLAISLVAMAAGCRSTKSIEKSAVTKEQRVIDSVQIRYKTVEVPVPGAVTPTKALDIDSLVKALAAMKSGEKTTTQIIRETEPVYITSEDPEGSATLKYWIDEYGKLQFNCTARDKQVQALVAEVERLRSETRIEVKEVFKEKIVRKSSFWTVFLWSLASFILGVVGVLFAAYLYNKRWSVPAS